MAILILAVLSALAVLVALGAVAVAWHQRRRRLQTDVLLRHTNDTLEQLQLDFGRFAPWELIERLTASDLAALSGRRMVTVLFADLRGFTALCDQLEPETVVELLNGYFQCMTEAIKANHGQVTELVGDGMLALFGALDHNPWRTQDAVRSALAMRSALATYNAQLRARGMGQLRFGIGIHDGEVIAGVIGNAELSKFGVVGDTINVASRVEGLTGQLGVDILITEDVRGTLDARFRVQAMPSMPVKGKEAPLVTYQVLDYAG